MGTWKILSYLVTLAFLFDSLHGLQIPQFLKKKYAAQYGQPDEAAEERIPNYQMPPNPYLTKTKSRNPYAGKGSGYSPYTFNKIKTHGTKTNHIKTKINNNAGCSSSPPSPQHAAVRCSNYAGCRADCQPNYQFPNGRSQMTFTCVNGQWQDLGNEFLKIPSCEPICLPPCQNNGICFAPNQCNCPENFSGPQCQFEKKPCLNFPPKPLNSRRVCNHEHCTITCMPGHEFSDGSQIAQMVCKDGFWVPSKDKWVSLPDCQATCDPPCMNGGVCLSFNVCQCPMEFRGSQCQYSVDACKKPPHNGAYNCSGDGETFSCSVSCPKGVNFEFPPERLYTCYYSVGIFQPAPIPKCLYPDYYDLISTSDKFNVFHPGNRSSYDRPIFPGRPQEQIIFPESISYTELPDMMFTADNIHEVNPGHYGRNEHQMITIEQRRPKPGYCFHWGGTHYKTFDSQIFSFDSKCPHTLVQDSVDNTFSIISRNHEDCYNNPVNCHNIINIFLQNREYQLKRNQKGVPVFTTPKKVLPIPGQQPGVRIEMIAHHILVTLDSVGAKIKWDGQQLVQIEVSEGLWNRTEGLCGKIDGDPDNDIMTKEQQKPRSVSTLAASWKVQGFDVDGSCEDAPTEDNFCEDMGIRDSLPNKATLFCKNLLSDPRFAACQKVMDITVLMEACRWDYCNCKENDRTICACETLNVYVQDCTKRGVKGLATWRDENTCPMQCSGGKVYKACGPLKGQPGCGSAVEILEEQDGDICVEGCYCPQGTVLHADKCITKDRCPCMLRGKEFPSGSVVPKDCNKCTCNDGQWICTQVNCGARCSAVGDPHYVTFDGKKYDFMGQCTYYLVKTQNFSIEAENVACAGSISQAMMYVPVGMPSCTKTVTIRYDGYVMKLKQNHNVLVNGQYVTRLPYTIGGVNIKSLSSIFLLTKLANGVEIWWDGVTRVYIDVPSDMKGKTKGLCGTFNNNQKDDFLTPEDDVEQAVIAFANKWKTSEKCNDIPETIPSHPCDNNLHRKSTAEKYCSKLKSKMFNDCHFFVDPNQSYKDCLYDMCACEFKVSKCFCPIISNYATECSRQGIKLDWRAEVRECGVHCTGGQKYQVCGNSCTRTCFDISVDPDCKIDCAEGCNCPEGQALDDHGECIPIGQCKCQHEGLEFPAGYKEVRPTLNGQELCTCLNAIWNCRPATADEIVEHPRAADLKTRCDSSKNFEFTTCESVEPITCKNMHSPDLFTASICHSGCQCKGGYVLDSRNKKCVKPEECPCHHGGKSYKENSTVQSDCNTCVCQNGTWSCTDRQCTAECSAWGDSHYKTFDGKHYDYQGQCDYVLAKGFLGNDAFDITIQNVPCGSLGTACSKAVTIRINSGDDTEIVVLSKEKPIPHFKTYKHIVFREKGMFIIIEGPDLGLVVHWDKGTRVYVKVDPRWKNKMKGLCGNYNDNDADDFQTPSGGLTEVSANIFGDSWRLQSYCPEALEVPDTCEDRPDRKVWALKQCGIMKSSLFAPCHSEVPIDYYFDKCVFDSCACDQGGDCECLCTALAAYTQECNNRGAPIKWRSQQLCPIQCDKRCTEYSPCISTCPEETCDNFLVNKRLSKSCAEDTCIEGCAPRPCPKGYIYANSTLTECVPRNVCKPVCMEINNVTYYEGDLIEEDDCHSCYCSMQEKICRGQPCTTLVPPEMTTHQQEQIVECKSGWTQWINQDKASFTKGKKRNQQIEIEPVPSAILLNNLKDSARCNLEQMVNIECRTVGTQIDAKSTGLDVECSLENGLVCKSSSKGKLCPDIEVRVKCQCETPTTIPPGCDIGSPPKEHETDCFKFYECAPGMERNEWVEKTCGPTMMYNPQTMVCDWPETVQAVKDTCVNQTIILEPEYPACPAGMSYDTCAVECDRLCLYYREIVQAKGLCQWQNKCEHGCVNAEKKLTCPPGTFYADDHTCVSIDECICVSQNGVPLKPGKVVNEGDCKSCQCIKNHYSCHTSSCTTTTEVPDDESDDTRSLHPFEPNAHQVSVPPRPFSVTPPPECDESRFIHLIQGDQPILDDAFNASSELNSKFAASNSRLDSHMTPQSGGSWAPKYSNQDQYIQIDLGRQEPVYGVIIRGSPLYDEYVTSFKVLYSPDGEEFYYVLNDEKYPMIFRGSIDTTTPVKQIFETPVEAKVIRINPQTWNNGISLRLELIGCAEPITTTPATTKAYTKPNAAMICDDPLGLDDGRMSLRQISTSSDLDSQHAKANLKLNRTSYWQPLTNSPTESVTFDFLEPRNVTGVETKGGLNGWVKTYTVQYSHDDKDWNTVLSPSGNQIFLGNFDNNNSYLNSFDLPVCARYVRIIPVSWEDAIQMRIELHGCFKPYPVLAKEEVTTPRPLDCSYCPGIEAESLELHACRCIEGLWWNGEECVNRTMCPCMVGHIPYSIGSIFEKEDCQQCMCKIGGISYCTPKKCEPCGKDLRSTVTNTCQCTCRPCPDGTTLCPTSNTCINSTLWCNGVHDCSDDETDCPTVATEATPITTEKSISKIKPKKIKCPVVECHPGYKKVLKKVSKIQHYQAYLSPMISGKTITKNTKTSYIGVRSNRNQRTKGGSSRQNLQRPLPVIPELADEQPVCKEYKCVITKPSTKYIHSLDECPPANCQPSYIPVFDESFSRKKKMCPSYSCYPPPEPDAVCNITGRTFNTFDNVEFKYDICNHVLARDLEADEWEVLLKKNCNKTCSRDLIIFHMEHMIIIHPDLSVEFDGYRYSVEQTKSIGKQNEAFVVSQLGNTLLFVSNHYGFWIIWNKHGDVKLGVVHKLLDKVDGLCGHFNDYPKDDKRKPDGSLARTTEDFGDSWALANDQPAICEAKMCPLELQDKAWIMCNRVKEHSLSSCARVLDIDSFISRCLETTCSCLDQSGNNITAQEECRCQSMQSFVVDCLSADNTIDLSDWRMQQDCPISCESTLVYHDCYQRKCEPTCESISDPNVCPKINNMCFPGCYCPPGYVRKDDTCIKPSSCRDCECNLLPHLQYVTYDESNFTISGNCVYVMSRDILEDKKQHHFQVLVTNHPCKVNPNKMCSGKITILYEGHKIHIVLDKYRNKLKLIVDSERITDFDDISTWAGVRETTTKHFKILLTALQVEVSVYYPSLGVSVKAPSHKYGGRMEGLCGNCDGDPDDDFKRPDGTKAKTANDLGLSWLYENLPGGQSREQCNNLPEETCKQLPPDSNPCLQLLDVNKFGQCLNVLDPSLFINWCAKDICGGQPDMSCQAIEAYARDCASSGFCINWRNEFCPARACPADQYYNPCGTSNPKTCDSIKKKSKTVKKKKEMPTEGCFCPEGKVFFNDTCVIPKDCEVCDNEGHHPGDKWKKDKCTTCACEGTSLRCESEHCPGPSTICERGYNAIKIPSGDNECCDKYACIPEPTAGATCETPQKLSCGPGQNLKLDTKSNGCQTFICECKPREDCDIVDMTTDMPMDPGYVKEIDESGCCPEVKLICKKDLCPPSNDCPQYHTLKTQLIEGQCCSLYACESPKDKCIFETEYTSAPKGGERWLTSLERQKILKNANETWQDGPCRKCKCILTSLGNYQPTCSKTDCPSIKTHPDYADYDLASQPIYDQCCADIKRIGCKHNGKTYQVGDKWSIGNDHCTSMECVESASGVVHKELRVRTCDRWCELGYTYEEAKHDSGECCGACKPTACLVDGTLRNVGEEWTSLDHCVNYFCVNVNGSLQAQAVIVDCPKVPYEMQRDYELDTITINGECCKEYIPVACKEGERVYKVGESWPSPDGDKCKIVKCLQKKNKGVIKQESVEKCKRDCKKGWVYKESNHTCCGSCVQVACVIDGIIKQPNENWSSVDNCTTYTCTQYEDEFSVLSTQVTCPYLDDCPKENIYTERCCQLCNVTSSSQSMCTAEALPMETTVGIIKDHSYPEHGVCINRAAIDNFTECVGICHSSTFFNIAVGAHESVCSCCQATEYTSLVVELTCSNGIKKLKSVTVPSRCGCEGCAANGNKNNNKNGYREVPTKTAVKSARNV